MACPAEAPIFCGHETISRGLCVKEAVDCNSRAPEPRAVPKTPENEKAKDEVAKTPEVEAFILRKSDLTSSIKIPGELIANQQVDLYAKVNSCYSYFN
jgi:hypothetical protein